ncbi:MAG: hypothetical protein NTV23_04465 [Propionibacteriales bacterium]|nr:hypothetical protein [Propionibacteriales bacterium]
MSRINVLTAIRNHDEEGPGPFLAGLGFETSSDELLIERGRRYDARAILAYAHGKATGEFLTAEDIVLPSLQVLTDLGFSVVFRSELDRPKTVTKPRARATGTSRATKTTTTRGKPEPVVKLCPTCFTQLAMSGNCDYCD